ncbi:foldase [Aquibacillus halophilus]|uniref:Foldase protein PrsA n=1 Tax=Aquibacillus halophilus TaxID=930132 RepID=A0A6A8DEQ4_9BACI|nr:peptidylprolyl isomerase [Aquibacillus halophilus]MRH44123.1 foldase [Aquibacillus halophilus]
MKKLVIAASLAAGVLALSACSSEDSEIVVETESGNVTKEEFYQELKNQTGETVLQDLVMKKILESEYEIDESQVDEQLNELKEQYGDQFEVVLQQSNYSSEDEFREALRLSLLQEKALTEGIEVTDEEIEQRYERLQTEYEASHILVESEEIANEVVQKLEEGEDFATLATEYSTDTQTAPNGGALGPITPGSMVPPFEEAVYNLNVDEVSEPVQTEYGFHVIKVTAENEVEDLEPLEDMKEQLRREIANSKIDNAAAQAKLAQLMEDANIDVKIDEFSDLFDQPEPTEAEATE